MRIGWGFVCILYSYAYSPISNQKIDAEVLIPLEVKNEIKSRLLAIEQEENVKLFYACESGSRAWGFPSSNSDFDVRFLYAHHPDWYLSIDLERKRDVIERPINDELDISGWDIRKALQLFRKSNPPLLEWIKSPIVYRNTENILSRWKSMVPKFYSPIASFYHYLHMAKGNHRSYLQGEEVWTKKYFYVLRPLLAMQWIEQSADPVPMEFAILVDALVTDSVLKQSIEDLLVQKMAGKELDRGPKIDSISNFIESELTRLEEVARSQKPSSPPKEELNEFFRWALTELWI